MISSGLNSQFWLGNEALRLRLGQAFNEMEGNLLSRLLVEF